MKAGIFKVVTGGIRLCPVDQFTVTFDAHDLKSAGGNGQGKITQATKQIQYTIINSWVQQFHHTGDHAEVNLSINLHKIRRFEYHIQVVIRNLEAKFKRFGFQAVNGCRAFWLQ